MTLYCNRENKFLKHIHDEYNIWKDSLIQNKNKLVLFHILTKTNKMKYFQIIFYLVRDTSGREPTQCLQIITKGLLCQFFPSFWLEIFVLAGRWDEPPRILVWLCDNSLWLHRILPSHNRRLSTPTAEWSPPTKA